MKINKKENKKCYCPNCGKLTGEVDEETWDIKTSSSQYALHADECELELCLAPEGDYVNEEDLIKFTIKELPQVKNIMQQIKKIAKEIPKWDDDADPYFCSNKCLKQYILKRLTKKVGKNEN